LEGPSRSYGIRTRRTGDSVRMQLSAQGSVDVDLAAERVIRAYAAAGVAADQGVPCERGCRDADDRGLIDPRSQLAVQAGRGLSRPEAHGAVRVVDLRQAASKFRPGPERSTRTGRVGRSNENVVWNWPAPLVVSARAAAGLYSLCARKPRPVRSASALPPRSERRPRPWPIRRCRPYRHRRNTN